MEQPKIYTLMLDGVPHVSPDPDYLCYMLMDCYDGVSWDKTRLYDNGDFEFEVYSSTDGFKFYEATGYIHASELEGSTDAVNEYATAMFVREWEV